MFTSRPSFLPARHTNSVLPVPEGPVIIEAVLVMMFLMRRYQSDSLTKKPSLSMSGTP